jgi:membrane protease YdiL (CAAX protease family)
LLAVIVGGSIFAPVLFSLGQFLAAKGMFPALARYNFESYFDRAILAAALLFFWPLFRSLHIRDWRDLGLEKNALAARDAIAGFLIAALPLFAAGAVLIALRIYSLRHPFLWEKMPVVLVATIVVPLLEELLFRGFVLGVLLRRSSRFVAVILTSALFAMVHFLKFPATTLPNEHNYWFAGFIAFANSFSQFAEPSLIVGGFLTLFLLGCILADARLVTRSLWLPIGLHAGWIFASGFFSRGAHRESEALPWIGKNLLVGIVPLSIALVSWALVRLWINHARARAIESIPRTR